MLRKLQISILAAVVLATIAGLWLVAPADADGRYPPNGCGTGDIRKPCPPPGRPGANPQ